MDRTGKKGRESGAGRTSDKKAEGGQRALLLQMGQVKGIDSAGKRRGIGGSEVEARTRVAWQAGVSAFRVEDGRDTGETGRRCVSLRLECRCGRGKVVVAKDVLARVDDVQEAVFVPVGLKRGFCTSVT